MDVSSEFLPVRTELQRAERVCEREVAVEIRPAEVGHVSLNRSTGSGPFQRGPGLVEAPK